MLIIFFYVRKSNLDTKQVNNTEKIRDNGKITYAVDTSYMCMYVVGTSLEY